MSDYKSPYPYFGGKSRIAAAVWERLGADVANYVEPFFGSGAVLLARPGFDPQTTRCETVNDIDGFISNFWRALQHDPEAVAHYADWPVNENDLHARHAWLVQNHLDTLQPRLEGDPDYYDVKVAGWWVWGMAVWIGSGFCSGRGPWRSVVTDDGVRILANTGNNGQGVWRQLVHLGDNGQGVKRQLVHLGTSGAGVSRRLVHLGDNGRGVQRRLVHLGDGQKPGTGECGLLAWMEALAERMRRVRVASGDWSRVCGPSPTINIGVTAVFLDPPYSKQAERYDDLYAQDDMDVAHAVREWAIAHGDDPRYRIALCGYDVEHAMPDNWTTLPWVGRDGYTSTRKERDNGNRYRETVWFSPHCLPVVEPSANGNGNYVGALWDEAHA